MQIQNGAQVPTGSACPNKAQRYLLALAPAGADAAIEVLLWIA
jgi:hypothetical protein